MRKLKEIGLICREPGFLSLKQQKWQPIITNDCLIKHTIHVPQTTTMITGFLLGKISLNTKSVTENWNEKQMSTRRLMRSHSTAKTNPLQQTKPQWVLLRLLNGIYGSDVCGFTIIPAVIDYFKHIHCY